MTTFFTRPKRRSGMAGELARKARGAVSAAGGFQVRRVGGRSSMIRLSVPREDSAAWTEKALVRAATLAHWMNTSRGRAAPDWDGGEFAVSAFSSSLA